MRLKVEFNKIIKWIVAILVLLVFAFLYRTYNPIGNSYFPKCPFKLLTGYECPGCGSQRAIHYLLNLELVHAMRENILLVISIPYILTGLVIDSIKSPSERILKWRKRLFGQNAIIVILVLIVGFWILRNIFDGPQGLTLWP